MRRIRSMALPKSMVMLPLQDMPNSPAAFTSWAARLARMMPLEGTHPTFRQSPPMRWRSMRATFAPSPRRSCCRDQSRSARADHDQVVTGSRFRVFPAAWMNILSERPVVFIIRKHQRGGFHAATSQFDVVYLVRALFAPATDHHQRLHSGKSASRMSGQHSITIPRHVKRLKD